MDKPSPDSKKAGSKGVRVIWGIKAVGGPKMSALRFQKKEHPKFTGQRTYTAEEAKTWIETHPTIVARSPEESKKALKDRDQMKEYEDFKSSQRSAKVRML